MKTSTALPPAASALGVSFDGRAYHYREYSYDRLADALDYAKLDRAKPGFRDDLTPRHWKQWFGPTPQDRLQMAAHGIGYECGRYYYGPYRYELLGAALDYARREPVLSRGGQQVINESASNEE
jgi:hypothetical protein